jgi:cytochrome c-type biogenesis protein CcmH/NrfG
LQDAERYLRQTLELAPNHAQALDFMGKIQAVKGDARTAIDYYRKALQADSTNADARKNLAEALAQLPALDPLK